MTLEARINDNKLGPNAHDPRNRMIENDADKVSDLLFSHFKKAI
jgi:hypothetical protein